MCQLLLIKCPIKNLSLVGLDTYADISTQFGHVQMNGPTLILLKKKNQFLTFRKLKLKYNINIKKIIPHFFLVYLVEKNEKKRFLDFF